MKPLFVIFIIVLVIRIASFYSSIESYPNGSHIRITSRISFEPVRYSDAQYFKLRNLKIYLPLYPEVGYGDSVIIEGRVEEDKLREPQLLSLKENTSSFINLQSRLISFFKTSLPEPHAALLAGMVLGAKQNIPADFWEALKSTGTIHVIVASGMNVTLVANFLVLILITFMKRRNAVIFALGGVWLYAVLAGFDAPIIRATVMGSIAFSAVFLGRLTSAWRALIISAYIMLFIKPEWLTDLGFILSFVATASLLVFEKRVSRFFKRVPVFLREGLATSCAAQIGVAPILFITFGQFNILSPVINALVLWTVPIITSIGFVAVFVGLIYEPLGRGILYFSYPFTSWFIGVVQLLAQ